MGIRYYAYPVEAAAVDDARANPFNYLGVDPLLDAWGPRAERPEMLYLDKCWSVFQQLLATPPAHPSRPAAALVAGDVVNTPDGWIPHIEVLAPSQVAEVASDLDTVGDDEVRQFVHGMAIRYGTEEQELSSMLRFLHAAREFVTRLAKDNRGLIYLIG